MSSIPTKQIDGDVAVGRNVSAGGDVNIQGNARVGHDLIVEGWLDARNIKGPSKGLFASEGELKDSYPSGRAGWWALVGEGVPAEIYVWTSEGWQGTGKMVSDLKIDGGGLLRFLSTEDAREIGRRIFENGK